MCTTGKACEQAVTRVRTILTRLGLELHPGKTRTVKLFDGEEGFDFLGCHLHKRLRGAIWERSRKRLYFLNRWPSRRSMSRIRQRVKELTPRARCHAGNAATCFNQVDGYVWRRLNRLRIKRKRRQLQPADARKWSPDYFESFGLHRLRGTVRYPEAA